MQADKNSSWTSFIMCLRNNSQHWPTAEQPSKQSVTLTLGSADSCKNLVLKILAFLKSSCCCPLYNHTDSMASTCCTSSSSSERFFFVNIAAVFYLPVKLSFISIGNCAMIIAGIGGERIALFPSTSRTLTLVMTQWRISLSVRILMLIHSITYKV